VGRLPGVRGTPTPFRLNTASHLQHEMLADVAVGSLADITAYSITLVGATKQR